MTDHSNISRIADRKAPKKSNREAKKQELAASAINALKRFGYARTTLRDIAAASGQSLGMWHYYFESKEDLLVYCVRQYKEQFVSAVSAATAGVDHAQELRRAFCRSLADAIDQDAETHRLWYDIRSQSMFDESFVPVALEVEAMLVSLFHPFTQDHSEQVRLYVRFDGAFRYLLHQKLNGAGGHADEMSEFFYRAGFGD